MNQALPTLRSIRDAHSWKREYERYLPVSRFLFRPAGFLVTWFFIRIGLSSETVSWLSGAIGLTGCLCLAMGDPHWVLTGIGLLFLFNLLDCVDGSIARTMETQNPYGRFLDSICGTVVDLFFWFAVGLALFRSQDLMHNPFGSGPPTWAFLGAITGFLYLYHGYLERTFDELLREYWEDSGRSAGQTSPAGPESAPVAPPYSGAGGLLRMISVNLRVRETQYVLILLAFWGKALDLLLIFYFMFYLVQNIVLLITYTRRGRIIKKGYKRAGGSVNKSGARSSHRS